MIVHIRCARCGHKHKASGFVLGTTIACPRCGQMLKVEAGPTLGGEATVARVSLAEAPSLPPKPSSRESDKEPSAWRNPATWIAFATIAALVIIFVTVVYYRPAATAPSGPGANAVPPAEGGGTAGSQTPSPAASVPAQPPETTPGADTTGQAAETKAPSPETVPTGKPPTSEAPPAPAPSPPPIPPSPEPPELPPPSSGKPEAELSAEALFKQASPAVVRIVVRDRNFRQVGLGSGFLVTSDGVLVTNHHVVAGAAFATIALPSEATLFVEGILALDEKADLAVLKVNGRDLPHLSLLPKGETPAVGARVYAIGNPQGLANSLSEGLISGVRQEEGMAVLQTTAPISPGSSGGPLLDAQGRVVGVTTAIRTDEERVSQNLNFAVPSDNVHGILETAKQGRPVPLASAGGSPLGREATKDLQEAWAAMNDERWNDAVLIIQRLRKADPRNPQVWFMLGLLHHQLGNYDLALEAFREEVRLAPQEASGHLGLGATYHGLKRYSEAVGALRTAVRLSPDLWPAHLYLGTTLHAMGRYTESAGACRTVVRLHPSEPTAYYLLGLDYLAMRDRTRAIQTCDTLAKLDPVLAADLRSKIQGR